MMEIVVVQRIDSMIETTTILQCPGEQTHIKCNLGMKMSSRTTIEAKKNDIPEAHHRQRQTWPDNMKLFSSLIIATTTAPVPQHCESSTIMSLHLTEESHHHCTSTEAIRSNIPKGKADMTDQLTLDTNDRADTKSSMADLARCQCWANAPWPTIRTTRESTTERGSTSKYNF